MQHMIQMFDKIQMILMMKTSISNNRISRLNYLTKSHSMITHTGFTHVSARGAHLILSSQRGALIRGTRSFEGGAH